MILPEDYCIQKFLQLAGYPKRKHNGRVYEGGCPVCREGDSWTKKRRLYFILKNNHIYCHNCGWTGDPIKFIQQVEGISYKNIMEELRGYDVLPRELDLTKTEQKVNDDKLPIDSINLCDSAQMEYYSSDEIVKTVYDFTNKRKLLTAVNRPKTLWVSLSDYIHKNRLVLPFYDENSEVVFYQSRTVFPTEKLPKYLSKSGSEKTLFNLNNVDPELDKLFIFEGPIDACFCKNGIAVAGIQTGNTQFTVKQNEQLQRYKFFDKIWVLDSQWQDKTSRDKSISLAEQGETVFIWPEDYGKKFKDFNDMAIALDTNEIPYKFILDNSHTGLKVRVLLNVSHVA